MERYLMKSKLFELIELTERLQTFDEITLPISGAIGAFEIKVIRGYCVGFSILHEEHISILRHFACADTLFPQHNHAQNEWLFVYEGSMTLIGGDKETTIKMYETIYLPPNTPHGAYFPENCRFVAITMPGDPAWSVGLTRRTGDSAVQSDEKSFEERIKTEKENNNDKVYRR
jgi:quercetin dioxygenase-like cupin family protein